MTGIVDLLRTLRSESPDPWRRNLAVLWFAQFVAMIGMSSCIPFLPLFIHELGVRDADAHMWSGIITAAPFVMSASLTPLWGALGDKYGQKSMVVRGIFGLALAMTLMGFSVNIWMLLFLRMFQGAVSGFVASTNAFVSAQTPIEHSGYALSTLQTSIWAGNIIGPLVGGAIADAFGMRTTFFFVGGMCVISLMIIVLQVHQEKREGGKERGGASRRTTPIRTNIGLVIRRPELSRPIVLLFISQTAIVLVSPIMPYYIRELGAPQAALATIAGSIVSLVGVMSIITAPWWGRRADVIGFGSTMKSVTILVVIGMLLQSVVPSYGWLYPVRILIGLGVGAIIPMLYAELTRNSPSTRKGGMMGLASSATLVGNLVGPLLCSLITLWFPLRWAFVASAMLMSISFLLARRSDGVRASAHL